MLLDGKQIRDELLQEFKTHVSTFKGRKPTLAALIIGDNPASKIYVSNKIRACEKVGIHSIKRSFDTTISENDLLKEIHQLNQDDNVDGILVQLPLPSHINENNVTLAITPEKDVDGFHPLNLGKLLIGDQSGFVPCTPLGIKILLEKTNVDLTGLHAVIIGRSSIVGKPLAALLVQKSTGLNLTVTIAHSKTKDLKNLLLDADIIIAAIGKPHFVTADMVKDGAIVIDVGINRVSDPNNPKGYRIVGDVDFEAIKEKSSFITPVPGGVGPMTIAMLLHNTLKSYRERTKR